MADLLKVGESSGGRTPCQSRAKHRLADEGVETVRVTPVVLVV